MSMLTTWWSVQIDCHGLPTRTTHTQRMSFPYFLVFRTVFRATSSRRPLVGCIEGRGLGSDVLHRSKFELRLTSNIEMCVLCWNSRSELHGGLVCKCVRTWALASRLVRSECRSQWLCCWQRCWFKVQGGVVALIIIQFGGSVGEQ